MTPGRPTLQLVGERYGRLVVIAQAPTLRYSRWRCQCDCGATVVVSAQLLRMGTAGTRSCGCLHREQSAANLRRIHAEQRLPQYRREQRPASCTLTDAWPIHDSLARRCAR